MQSLFRKSPPACVTKIKIWHLLRIVLRSEWEKCIKKGEKSEQALDKQKYLLDFDFGSSEDVYLIDAHNHIEVIRIPPKPDFRGNALNRFFA